LGTSIRTIRADGTVSCENDDVGFEQGGNAFGVPAVLGTIDNQALDLRVNNARAMRYEPGATSPNLIGGSPANRVTAGVVGATIGGGGTMEAGGCQSALYPCWNRVTDNYATVAGGRGNQAGDNADNLYLDGVYATVGGGYANAAWGQNSTVAGGVANTAIGKDTFIGGGALNSASGEGATISGGYSNSTGNFRATVGGGVLNAASGFHSTVGGGSSNWANGSDSTVGGGVSNFAGGEGATVPGGYHNSARGQHSFAAGRNAIANENHTFVWGGGSLEETVSQGEGSFVVYAPGGVYLFAGSPGSGGCTLLSGSSGWSCSSDRSLKSGIVVVEASDVLDRVVSLPIARWSFTAAPGVAHMGPMAQDFHATFGLGDDPTRLAPMDVQGVALAAIQGLNAKLEERVARLAHAAAVKDDQIQALSQSMSERDAQIASQQRQIEAQQRAMDEQRAELARLRLRVAEFESVRNDLAALRDALAEMKKGPLSVVASREQQRR
jgi:hypothetical protein